MYQLFQSTDNVFGPVLDEHGRQVEGVSASEAFGLLAQYPGAVVIDTESGAVVDVPPAVASNEEVGFV